MWHRRLTSPDSAPVRASTATAVAAEWLRTGRPPRLDGRARHARVGNEQILLVGDPDDDWLSNAYVGDETPGGSAPTPDQSLVDEIGRVYGLSDEDSCTLVSAAEVLGRRDRRRAELQAPRRPTV